MAESKTNANIERKTSRYVSMFVFEIGTILVVACISKLYVFILGIVENNNYYFVNGFEKKKMLPI